MYRFRLLFKLIVFFIPVLLMLSCSPTDDDEDVVEPAVIISSSSSSAVVDEIFDASLGIRAVEELGTIGVKVTFDPYKIEIVEIESPSIWSKS